MNLIARGRRFNKAAPQYFPLFIALLGMLGTLLAIYEIDHRFFFMDDRQSQYFPYGLVIRDMLLHGHFPFLTTRTFFGGALWLDLQNGIYNPLALAMTFLIDTDHLEISGLMYALVINTLLATAAYELGRAYGIRPAFSALLALMGGINLYTLYINSADWHPAVTSLAWLLFAWAALKRLPEARTDICWRILGAAVLIFLSVSAGWPHNDVALAVVMTVLFLVEFRKSRRGGMRLAWAGALGAAFSLPVIVPAIVAMPFTARAVRFVKQGLFTAAPSDLLNFSNPSWFPNIVWFDPHQAMACPFFFVAWFALPLLLLADPRRLRWPRELLFMIGALVMLTTEAGQLGPLRFPMRWLPDMQLCLLLAIFFAIEKSALKASPRRMLLVFGVLCLTTLADWAKNPSVTVDTLSYTMLAGVFIAMLPLIIRRGGAWLPVFLGATSIVLALLMVAQIPSFLDPGKANETPALPANAAPETRVSYTLNSGDFTKIPDKKDETEYLPGAMNVYYGLDSFNGYSSLAPKCWGTTFGCKTVETLSCIIYVSLLLHKAAEPGIPYLDLFKIDTIAAQKGLPAFVATAALPHWRRRDMPNTVHLSRPDPSPLPGTVSWRSAGLSLDGPADLEPNGEAVTVANTSDASGLVAFARLYFPGFRAFMNDQELNVRPIDDLVVGVEVPPHAAGTLRLTFLPPFLIPSVALAFCAFLLWAAAAFLERRGRLKRF